MAPTVLIVEDDEPTQTLLKALMQRSGMNSLLAQDGAAAIAMVEERDDIDCLILDLMMPSVDGMSVVRHLSEAKKGIPVIVCTAAVSATMPAFDPEVVRAVIRKPFDIEQLAATTAELIASRS